MHNHIFLRLIFVSGVLLLYLPVSISGYAVFGYGVNANILFATTQGVAVKVAQIFQIVNLAGSYVIGFNVQAQAAEDVFNIAPGKINCGNHKVFVFILHF